MMHTLLNHLIMKTPARPTSGPVLIVDDDSINRKILRLFLEADGYPCLEANNGKTALGIIRMASPGFIITDFHMPDVNGCELLEQLSRDDGAHAPAVLITGNLTNQIRQRASRAGVITVLEKPFDPKTLLGIIHRWISGPSGAM